MEQSYVQQVPVTVINGSQLHQRDKSVYMITRRVIKLFVAHYTS